MPELMPKCSWNPGREGTVAEEPWSHACEELTDCSRDKAGARLTCRDGTCGIKDGGKKQAAIENDLSRRGSNFPGIDRQWGLSEGRFDSHTARMRGLSLG